MSEQLPPPELELLLEEELEELLDEDELDELLDEEELDELLLEDELEELLDDEPPPPNCASIQPWKRSYVHWFRPHSP
jgi:hypothetical protein